MKVKMIETTQGSPDGLRVVTYERGVIYDLPKELFDGFLKRGIIDVLEGKPAEVKIEAPEEIKKPKAKKREK